jgi:hypothetical protein
LYVRKKQSQLKSQNVLVFGGERVYERSMCSEIHQMQAERHFAEDLA